MNFGKIRMLLFGSSMLLVILFTAIPADAQFPIRIPRVNVPRTQPSNPQPTTPRTNTPGQQVVSGNQAAMRRDFMNEFRKYSQSVYYMMSLHDPQLHVGQTGYGPANTKEKWQTTMRELEEMDAACKSKYAGMTDDPGDVGRRDLNSLPATWCAIAANRFEYEKRGKTAAVARQARHTTDQISKELDEADADREDRIALPLQIMFWETDKWKAEMFAKLKPTFDEMDATIPDDYLDSYINRGQEIKAKRMTAGEARTFPQPPHRDAPVETWVRAQYKQRGIEVLNIGSNYTDWRIFTNRVGIPTSRTKRGWALVRVQNRPMCQAREWIVRQDYSGGGRYTANKVDSLGHSGILMKCQ